MPSLDRAVAAVSIPAMRGFLRHAVPVSVRQRLSRAMPSWTIAVAVVDDPLAPRPETDWRPVFTRDELRTLGIAFIGDPFAVHRDGAWHLFFEVVTQGAHRGEIGVATSTDLHQWTYRGVVLREPFHLSFPSLLEDDGEVYLVPETATDRSVRLYRATDFPTAWQLDSVLLTGRPFKDTAILERDGSYYLFSETSTGYTDDELRLFVSDSLRTGWREHPASPLVSHDPDAARPGGRPALVDGRLVRFSQCCAKTYGEAVRAHEVSELTASTYAERALPDRVVEASGQGWNAAAMHHVDVHQVDGGWVVFVDGHD